MFPYNPVLVIVIFIIFIIMLIKAIKKLREYYVVKDIPTSKIRSIALGLVEIFGKGDPENLFKSPISNTECVFYRYIVKERHSNGKNSYWRTVIDEKIPEQITVYDDTGKIQVNTRKAETFLNLRKAYFNSSSVFNLIKGNFTKEKLKELDIKNNKPNMGFRFVKTGDRIHYEYFIKPNEDIYVLGTAKNKEGSSELYIDKGENNKFFMISDTNENKLIKKLFKKILIYFTISGISLIVSLIMIITTIKALL